MFLPFAPTLAAHGIRLVVVGTGQPAQARKFVASLGFELPGVLVLDPERRTHAALGTMRSSVCRRLPTAQASAS